jgi:hypothetical protein
MEWLASCHGSFTPNRSPPPLPGTNWVGSKVGPFGRYGEETFCLDGIEHRFLGSLAFDPVAIPNELQILKILIFRK